MVIFINRNFDHSSLFFVSNRFIPESVLWLKSTNKAKEANKILSKIAGVSYPEQPHGGKAATSEESNTGASNSERQKTGFKELFRMQQ